MPACTWPRGSPPLRPPGVGVQESGGSDSIRHTGLRPGRRAPPSPGPRAQPGLSGTKWARRAGCGHGGKDTEPGPGSENPSRWCQPWAGRRPRGRPAASRRPQGRRAVPAPPRVIAGSSRGSGGRRGPGRGWGSPPTRCRKWGRCTPGSWGGSARRRGSSEAGLVSAGGTGGDTHRRGSPGRLAAGSTPGST